MAMIGGGWRQALFPRDNLKLLQQTILLSSLAIVVVTAGLPIYSTELGATGLEVGQLFSFGALATALPRPIIGRALDAYGRKLFLVAGMALVCLAMVLFAMSRDVGMLLAANAVQGLGTGTMLLAAYTMTADLTMRHGRGGSFGSTEQAQYRGGLYGAVIALPILLFTGFNAIGQLRITPQAWSIMFGVFAAGGVVALCVAVAGLNDTYAVRASEEPGEHDTRIDRHLYVLMAIVALTSASVAGIAPFILKFIQDHITQDLVTIGLAYLPASIVWGFLPARMGHFADRYGRKLPIAVGLTVSGLFSAVIPLLTTILPLTLFATVEAMCYSAAVPAEQALVADMTGGKRRGIGFGLYTLSQSGGKVLGPLVMGWLYDQVQSGPFLANAVILFVGSLLVLFLLRYPAGHRPSPAGAVPGGAVPGGAVPAGAASAEEPGGATTEGGGR
jgi:MFS family permease